MRFDAKIGLVASALLGMTLSAASILFVRNLEQLRHDVESTFSSRSELIDIFFALHRDQVAVMHNLMVAHYRRPVATERPGWKLHRIPQRPVWELVDAEGALAGRLTGGGPLPLSASQQHEIGAALSLDVQVHAALESSRQVAWLYYLSASGFIYLAPSAPLERFAFSPQLFERDYWRDAGPRANPQRRMVLSGPYRDPAGKGGILTLSQPVYDGERMLGVVGIDLHIDMLQRLAGVGQAIGQTLLVSEKGHPVVGEDALDPPPPTNDRLVDWQRDASGDLWLRTPVVRDELWALHHVPRHALHWAAARGSLPAWMLLLLLAVLCFFAWRLAVALRQVTRLTRVDPLTQTLNRRGFYDKAIGLQALAVRKNLPLAVLLLDIDYFKRVNDTHGHVVGDHLLRQVGRQLLEGRRPFDLVCRWGGEEFVVLLLLERPEQAYVVAERLRQEAQRGDRSLTLSGGLTLLQAGETLDQAIARADQQLYLAKQRGRQHIEYAPGSTRT